jgi:hypothetical protein
VTVTSEWPCAVLVMLFTLPVTFFVLIFAISLSLPSMIA